MLMVIWEIEFSRGNDDWYTEMIAIFIQYMNCSNKDDEQRNIEDELISYFLYFGLTIVATLFHIFVKSIVDWEDNNQSQYTK